MTLKEILKGKTYNFIEYRIYVNFPDAGETEDTLFGFCAYKNGELISLDGDTYSLESEMEKYEEIIAPEDIYYREDDTEPIVHEGETYLCVWETADEVKEPEMEIGNLLFGHSRGAYHIDRDECESVFCKFLEEAGFDSYGHPDSDETKAHWDNNDYCTDMGNFVVRPYYWGDDENIAERPNFEYPAAGLEIRWYKYPLRDAYSNVKLTKEKMTDIIGELKQ